jgi:hypothetical protein
MGKTNFFLCTLPFSPRAILATWKLLKKYKKNELNIRFEQNFTTGSYEVRIGHAWYQVHGKLAKYVVHSSKRKK